jgi:hypothetical protein
VYTSCECGRDLGGGRPSRRITLEAALDDASERVGELARAVEWREAAKLRGFAGTVLSLSGAEMGERTDHLCLDVAEPQIP